LLGILDNAETLIVRVIERLEVDRKPSAPRPKRSNAWHDTANGEPSAERRRTPNTRSGRDAVAGIGPGLAEPLAIDDLQARASALDAALGTT